MSDETSGSVVRAGDGVSTTRRRFVAWVGGAAATAAALVAAVPVLGFLFSPLRRRPEPVWRAVGSVADFAEGETVLVRYEDPERLPWAGYAGRSGAWLRHEPDGRFVAFSMYCTHVGCPVTWSPGAELFLCPCHGGTFRRDGVVAAGPPPRALDRLDTRVREGRVEIRVIGMPLPD